jgi:hypothetical protein
MKKVILTIVAFFLKIWNSFISIFKRKTQTPSEPIAITPQEENTSGFIENKLTRHNNRKTNKARYTQYVPMGNGIFKPIYHIAR